MRCGEEWTKGDGLYLLPSNLTFTTDEGTKKANIMADLDVLCAEMQAKFVTGVRPLSEFDDYIEQLKSLGILEVVDMYEAALARYNNRLNLINR